MVNVILALNSGSSSIKFALYPYVPSPSTPLLSGKITRIGVGGNVAPQFDASLSSGQTLPSAQLKLSPQQSLADICQLLLQWLLHHPHFRICAAGHRVVHGGRDYHQAINIDNTVLSNLETLCELAPLHEPQNLLGVKVLKSLSPELPQVACFDTAFHRTQHRLAQLFALPRALTEKGIIRYGFHGLSYEYIASQLPLRAPEHAAGNVIVAHLGNGASLCALQNQRSVATSMGFTALDGLMMGSRCGAIDPGVVLYLSQHEGLSIAEIEHLLYKESGLFGVSGISSDMAELERSDHPHAQEARDLFAYRVACEIGSLCAANQGLDALVFTGGIGEHSAATRAAVMSHLTWLGAKLDPAENARHTTQIHAPSSAVGIYVIATNEEVMLAKHTATLVPPLL